MIPNATSFFGVSMFIFSARRRPPFSLGSKPTWRAAPRSESPQFLCALLTRTTPTACWTSARTARSAAIHGRSPLLLPSLNRRTPFRLHLGETAQARCRSLAPGFLRYGGDGVGSSSGRDLCSPAAGETEHATLYTEAEPTRRVRTVR